MRLRLGGGDAAASGRLRCCCERAAAMWLRAGGGNAADSGRWRCGCERAAAMRPRAGGGAPPARSREQAAAMLLQQC